MDLAEQHHAHVTPAAPHAQALTVERISDARYQVAGGAEPHIVTVHPNGALCDCKAFQFRGRHTCKHIDAVASVQQKRRIDPAGGDGGPGLERDVPLPGDR